MRLAALLLFAAPGLALAHPSDAAGFVHPFLGLDHLLAMVAVGVWAAQAGGRWRWALPAAFVSAMAVGFAIGPRLPFIEPMIAASVLVLGLAVALQPKWRAAGAAVAAAFALFHGMAHGAEMPAEVSPFLYAGGFMLATALLHGVGLALGLVPRIRYAGIPVALAGAWLLTGSLV